MIEINENSAVPIYQQISDKLVKLIILKVLKEGDKLPSVRELALSLKINPNTIQKAYKLLENENYIVSALGKGNFVNSYSEIIKNYKTELDIRLSSVVNELILIGETKEDLLKHITGLIEEGYND